jgi:hypothetical protein
VSRVRRSLPALVAVALALALLASATAGPAAARAPPTPVCGVCTGALVAAADERGVAVDTAESALAIDVRADGTTRWTARVRLSTGADALRNDSLRRAVVADARSRVVEPTGVDSRVAGLTLVVVYLADGATAGGGAVAYTGLRPAGAPPFATGGEGARYLGADELVIRGPDGYVVRGTGTTSALRWTGSETTLDDDLTPTFVPADAAFPGVRAALARLLA